MDFLFSIVKSTAPPSEKSTMSIITTSGEESSKSTIATSVAESSKEITSKFYHVVRSSSTSIMVYSLSYFSKETTTATVTTEQQSREETQPKPREGPTVEIVVPLCLMSVLVVVLGIILWKKRYFLLSTNLLSRFIERLIIKKQMLYIIHSWYFYYLDLKS